VGVKVQGIGFGGSRGPRAGKVLLFDRGKHVWMDGRESIRGTVWEPVLEYKKFVMDRHMVQALIHAWNPDALAFMIGQREVQFSYFDIALLTGLPATGREVVFRRGDSAGEVEQLVMAAMEASLEKERQRRRGDRTDSRIYRNYVAVMIELCRQHNTVNSLPMFRKLFSLLVVSGLFFPRSAGGVAWELIDLVEDVDRLGDYNWAAAVWQFLVDALGETKEKMRRTKNVQISGFAIVLQVCSIYCFAKVCEAINYVASLLIYDCGMCHT